MLMAVARLADDLVREIMTTPLLRRRRLMSPMSQTRLTTYNVY